MKTIFTLSAFLAGFSLSAQKVVKQELNTIQNLDKVTALLNDAEDKNSAIAQKIHELIGVDASQIEHPFSFSGRQAQVCVAFYYKKELVFFMNYYHENSRMGSCGDIDIENFYRIEKGKITQTWHFEWPFACYNHSALRMEDILKLVD